MQSIGNTAADLAAASRLGQAKNPAATQHFVIFSQVLRKPQSISRAVLIGHI
jgi:hypothetical protein